MDKLFLSIFIDVENIAKFNLDELMRSLKLLDDQTNYTPGDKSNIVFAIKHAYGSLRNISSEFRNQLRDHGFTLIDTPHVARKKNRADLFISLDALESLYVNNPTIHRYVFLTSDSDFTVVGEKLRKYGKTVWLVCRKEDKERAIMSNAFDKLLFFEEYPDSSHKLQNAQQTSTNIKENDKAALELFKEVLKKIDLDKLPTNVSVINDRMKLLDPGFDIKQTNLKRFHKLVEYFEEEKIIETDRGVGRTLRLVNVDLSKLT